MQEPDAYPLLVGLLELERRARERAERANARLAAMQRLLEAALAHLSLEDLLHELLERIAELLHVDTAAILLREDDVLVVRAARGLDEQLARNVRLPMGIGLAGRVAAEQRPVILEDVPHAQLPTPMLKDQGLSSILGARLRPGHPPSASKRAVRPLLPGPHRRPPIGHGPGPVYQSPDCRAARRPDPGRVPKRRRHPPRRRSTGRVMPVE